MTEILARGRMAEVLAWGQRRVLKWYFPEFPYADALAEARFTDAIRRAGVEAPAVFEVLVWEGRPAIVLERVDGTPLLDQVWHGTEDEVCAAAVIMADLQLAIHRVPTESITELPLLRDKLTRRIQMAPMMDGLLQETLLGQLGSRPDGRAICHGDLYPGNILVSGSRVAAIDWIDASLGHPHGDVARTALLIEMARSWLLDCGQKWRLDLFAATYLESYAAGALDLREEVELWLPIMAGARLAEGIVEEVEHLMALARGGVT